MSHLRSWLEGNEPLVGDASVWINLAATGRMETVVGSTSRRFLITQTALSELEKGRGKGRLTVEAIAPLISSSLIELVELAPDHEETFISLVAGIASETLDDGEAATLAYAHGGKAIALIDERKATSIAQRRFPELAVVSTTELLMVPELRSRFTSDEFADVLFGALSVARMRVPDHLLEEVCTLLGGERLSHCPSIPARLRSAFFTKERASTMGIPGGTI